MTITLSSDDPRSSKALQIAAEDGQWLKCRKRDGTKKYGVPSQSQLHRYFLVDTRTCDCPDFQRRGAPCKHVLAVRTWVAQVRSRPAQGNAA
jgi:hypothetical protein